MNLAISSYNFRNWSLQQSSAGRVFNSGNGLFEITPTHAVSVDMPEQIRYKWIGQVALDFRGDIWIAIWSIGVFHLQSSRWTHFSELAGLDSDLVSFIINLGGRNPMVSTLEGHYRFDGQVWAPFMSFNYDGLFYLISCRRIDSIQPDEISTLDF